MDRTASTITVTQRPTPTQTTILQMMLDGFTQKQIAIALERQPITIKRHCVELKARIGVCSLYQAVAVAIIYGWVEIDVELIPLKIPSPG